MVKMSSQPGKKCQDSFGLHYIPAIQIADRLGAIMLMLFLTVALVHIIALMSLARTFSLFLRPP